MTDVDDPLTVVEKAILVAAIDSHGFQWTTELGERYAEVFQDTHPSLNDVLVDALVALKELKECKSQ